MFKKLHKTKKSKQDQEVSQLKNVYVKLVEGDLEFLEKVPGIETMKFTNVWNFPDSN